LTIILVSVNENNNGVKTLLEISYLCILKKKGILKMESPELIKILMVEDDEDDFIIISEILSKVKRHKFELDWAKDFDEGFMKASATEHDLCIVDYFLGMHTGFEFIDEYVRRGFTEPIIILTGQGDFDIDMLAMGKGAVDYIDKNRLDPVLLERSIRYAVRNSKILNRLKQSEKQLHYLSLKILETQEQERKTVARELHDSIGSSLTAIRFALEQTIRSMGSSSESASTGFSLEKIMDLLKEVIDESQRIAYDLRPSILDTLGLLAAIRSLCRRTLEIHRKIELDMRLELKEEDIPERLKIVCYRIIQECLNNALKHSNADHLQLHMRKSENILYLFFEDNGKGFDVEKAMALASEKNNMGLNGMIERVALAGGKIDIVTGEGQHTQIKIQFPVSG
jgi:signal transduction histidine kinase